MLRTRNILVTLAVTAVGIFAAIAAAGLWTNVASAGTGGTTLYSSYFTNGVLGDYTITGLGNIQRNATLISLTVYGTDSNGDGIGDGNTATCYPLNADGTLKNPVPSCYVAGSLYCTNNGGGTGGVGVPFKAQTAATSSDPITTDDCKKNGKCTAKVVVEPTLADPDPCTPGGGNGTNSQWDYQFVPAQLYAYAELLQADGFLLKELKYCETALPSTYMALQPYDSCTLLYTNK